MPDDGNDAGALKVNRSGFFGGLLAWVRRPRPGRRREHSRARFGLGGRDVADWREEATVVVPVDPLQGGVLDGLEGAPGSASGMTSALNRPLIVSAKALS